MFGADSVSSLIMRHILRSIRQEIIGGRSKRLKGSMDAAVLTEKPTEPTW